MVADVRDATWAEGCAEGLKVMENLQPFPHECEKFLCDLDLNKVFVDKDAFEHGHD